MTQKDLSRGLLILSLAFFFVWVASTAADPSSAVGYVGRVARGLAIGFLLGAAARLWWMGRNDAP